jgi:hypothetical protein
MTMGGKMDKASHEAELYPNPLPNIKTNAMTDRKSTSLLLEARGKSSTNNEHISIKDRITILLGRMGGRLVLH